MTTEYLVLQAWDIFCAVIRKTRSGTKVASWLTSEALKARAESHVSESMVWSVESFILTTGSAPEGRGKQSPHLSVTDNNVRTDA